MAGSHSRAGGDVMAGKKPKCPQCKGGGIVNARGKPPISLSSYANRVCPSCNGTGYKPEEAQRDGNE